VFIVADNIAAADGAMAVVVAPVFVVCAAVALPLLKCSHHHHYHHHRHLHNLKDGYNFMLNSLKFVLIILALYVNFP
jgi:fumarate reductase subunit D